MGSVWVDSWCESGVFEVVLCETCGDAGDLD